MICNFAVCDDDQLAIEAECSIVGKIFKNGGIEYTADRYTSPKELLAAIGQKHYDLVFLDIDMPEMDGVSLAQSLNGVNERPEIIFVSNRDDRVFDAFSVRPFYFVRKDSFLTMIERAVKSYIEVMSDDSKSALFELKGKTALVNVRLRDIVYIESYRNYQDMYLNGRRDPYCLAMTMDELERRFADSDIVRIHKGYLVNLRYVVKVTFGEVCLQNGVRLLISRRKSGYVKSRYLQYVYKNNVK